MYNVYVEKYTFIQGLVKAAPAVVARQHIWYKSERHYTPLGMRILINFLQFI